MTDELDTLAEVFRKAGAPDPESWAASQLEEGIPQLARFLFLRQAWKYVADEGNHDWINASIGAFENNPERPFSGVGRALASMTAKGVTDEEIIDLVRGCEAETLSGFCYLLEDPGLTEEDPEVEWALFQIDEQGQPIAAIDGLHESVLETDPTGREMRPRKWPG